MSHQPVIDRFELKAQLAGASPPCLLEALPLPYYEQGHLPGARALPLAELKKVAEARLTDKDAALVVYCASHTCRNSHVAAQALADLGYRRVSIYAGGKADWIEAGWPLEEGPERSAPDLGVVA